MPLSVTKSHRRRLSLYRLNARSRHPGPGILWKIDPRNLGISDNHMLLLHFLNWNQRRESTDFRSTRKWAANSKALHCTVHATAAGGWDDFVWAPNLGISSRTQYCTLYSSGQSCTVAWGECPNQCHESQKGNERMLSSHRDRGPLRGPGKHRKPKAGVQGPEVVRPFFRSGTNAEFIAIRIVWEQPNCRARSSTCTGLVTCPRCKRALDRKAPDLTRRQRERDVVVVQTGAWPSSLFSTRERLVSRPRPIGREFFLEVEE